MRTQLVQGKSSECNENVNERQTDGRHVLICDVGGYAWTITELELLVGSPVALMEISSSIWFENPWLLFLWNFHGSISNERMPWVYFLGGFRTDEGPKRLHGCGKFINRRRTSTSTHCSQALVLIILLHVWWHQIHLIIVIGYFRAVCSLQRERERLDFGVKHAIIIATG